MRPYQKLQRYKTVWVLMGNSAVLCVVIIYRKTLVDARTFVFIYSERVPLSSTQKLLLHCYRHFTRKPLVLWLIVPPQINPIALSCPTSKFFVMPSFTVFKGQNGGVVHANGLVDLVNVGLGESDARSASVEDGAHAPSLDSVALVALVPLGGIVISTR